jgi:hypothetical protein
LKDELTFKVFLLNLDCILCSLLIRHYGRHAINPPFSGPIGQLFSQIIFVLFRSLWLHMR